MTNVNRPNVFVKELKMYVDYLKNEISDFSAELSASQIKKWNSFKNNLLVGINYYQDMFSNIDYFKEERVRIQNQIANYRFQL